MAIKQSTESQDSEPQNSGLYDAPPPELVERADRARKELEALSARVEFKAKWWGFEIHLNQAAMDAYLVSKDHLADILGEAHPDRHQPRRGPRPVVDGVRPQCEYRSLRRPAASHCRPALGPVVWIIPAARGLLGSAKRYRTSQPG